MERAYESFSKMIFWGNREPWNYINEKKQWI